MTGYWNKPEENKAVFREIDGRRYFLTGDVGHIDPEGYIIVTDRKKDLILVGGFNCFIPARWKRCCMPIPMWPSSAYRMPKAVNRSRPLFSLFPEPRQRKRNCLNSARKDWPDTNVPDPLNSGMYCQHLRLGKFCAGYCGTRNAKRSERVGQGATNGSSLTID